MQRERDRRTEDLLDSEARSSRPGSGGPRRVTKRDQRRPSVSSPTHTSSTPSSATSTPKKYQKREQPTLDFTVQGRQLRKTDRANSLPTAYHRRQSFDSIVTGRPSKKVEVPSKSSSKSRESSLEDELSLDLSQDFEERYQKFPGMTSTPKSYQSKTQKQRRCSLQTQCSSQRVSPSQKKTQNTSFDSMKTCATYSKGSLHRTASNASSTFLRMTGRSTELDYSSVSPEYSGQSSAETSPRRSSVLHLEQSCTSSCNTSWIDSHTESIKHEDMTRRTAELQGEWNHFWENYNNSLSRIPMKTYYDQCPTPYRSDNFQVTDLDLTETVRNSPDNLENINQIIQKDGLHLTPRETQSVIKCAHILGSLLSKAIDRKAKEIINDEGNVDNNKPHGRKDGVKSDDIYADDPSTLPIQNIANIGKELPKNNKVNCKYEISKKHASTTNQEDASRSNRELDLSKVRKEKEPQEVLNVKEHTYEEALTDVTDKKAERNNLKLELKEQHEPLKTEVKSKGEVKETQTDISLPNTRSAPRIFENILRQLSKTSIEVKGEIQDES